MKFQDRGTVLEICKWAGVSKSSFHYKAHRGGRGMKASTHTPIGDGLVENSLVVEQIRAILRLDYCVYGYQVMSSELGGMGYLINPKKNKGTYSYKGQGTSVWGKTPPYSDQFFFIYMGYYFVRNYAGKKILKKEINGIRLIDRMEIAFHVPPSRQDSHIIYTTDNFRGVDFGFRDAETITGDICFPSILKYRASNELGWLFDVLGNKKKAEAYRAIAKKIKAAIPRIFADEKGMLRASTGKSDQPDVWGTALAVYFGVLDGKDREAACNMLDHAYKNGTMAYKGNIREVLTTDDFNDKTAWEVSRASKNTYQNGAYWGTPTGWVCYAIAQVDKRSAEKLAAKYISNLRETNYRKGKGFGGPHECFYPPDYKQNSLYLATVSCPYGVFRFMRGNKKE